MIMIHFKPVFLYEISAIREGWCFCRARLGGVFRTLCVKFTGLTIPGQGYLADFGRFVCLFEHTQ